MESCYVHVRCILANKLRSVPDVVLYALFCIFALTIGSGDRLLVHTGSVHGGFAVLLRTSFYEFVIMIPYCINMLDMKYACCRVDMCCVG